VVFSDTPGTNTAVVVGSVTTSQGTVTTGNGAGDTSVSVDIGTMAATEMVTITFDVTVDLPFPANQTSVSNQGAVAADGGVSVVTDDPDTVPALDPTSTPVESPDINVTKTDALFDDADGDTVPSPGDTIEYTIEVRNTGNVDLTGVTFSDTPGTNTALEVGSVTTSLGAVISGNGAGETSVSVDIGTVAVGATATITMRVTIVNPLPVGVTQVSNQGLVGTGETPDEPTDDPDTGTDNDPTDTTVTASPDLEAEKVDSLFDDADGSGGPTAGDTIRYTVTISNAGNTDATSVSFNDLIPANTMIVPGSVTSSQGTIVSEDPVSVTVGDVGVGSDVTIIFDVTIDDPLPGGVTSIANQGTVSLSNQSDVDTDDPDTPASDDPTETPVTAAPSLEADKTDILLTDADSSGGVTPGDTLSYSVTISNTGTTEATGVVFTDSIPINTAVVPGSVSSSQGTVDSEDPVQVTIGNIAANGSSTISFHVLIDDPLPAGVTTVSNQGTVSSSELPDEPTDDPDTVPDGDETITVVNLAPDLSIVKDDGDVTAIPGSTISYTLDYANNGLQDATGVSLTETVPSNCSFSAGTSTAGWVCLPGILAGSTCALTIGDLSSGGSGSVIFAVTLDNPVPVGVTQVSNTASIADDGSHGQDETPSDNSDSDTTPIVISSTPSLDATKEVEQLTDLNGNGLADAGESLRYTITVTNDGDTVIENAYFTDTPDSATTLAAGTVTTTSGSVPVGNGAGDLSVGVDLGDLAVAEIVFITFEVTINDPVPHGLTTVFNQGVVSSDTVPDEPTDDPGTFPDDDPTQTQLGVGATIPDLGLPSRFLLILILGGLGVVLIRRQLG
jgi:uncharacterized repeat protein (TIGR01451 family)